jgi:transcriptional regulator with XRE-family HTH domain
MSDQESVVRLSVSAAVGRRIRKFREEAGRSQDELADAARRAGIDWTRASVASLETGRRGLEAEEFMLLPLALKILTGRDQWRLGDLLPDVWIRMPLGAMTHARSLRRLLAGESVEGWGVAAGTAEDMDRAADRLKEQTEAVRHAARRLEVEPGTVSRAADRLWRRSFSEEREQRVAERGGAGASPRSLQAIRGHVTRVLINELRQALEQEESDG